MKDGSKIVLNSSSAEETKKIAEKFSKQLKPGDTICLYGNLGAGKTTFVQGLVTRLGIKKRVISPTFVIIRSYLEVFYHVDLYRLNEERDIEGTGLLEILDEKSSIVAIEWPEKLGNFLPKRRWEVILNGINNKRVISIIKYE